MSSPVGKVGIPQNSDSSARQAKAFKTALPVRPALTTIELKQKEKREKEERKGLQEEKAKANEEKQRRKEAWLERQKAEKAELKASKLGKKGIHPFPLHPKMLRLICMYRRSY